jgi:hypothetical protein
MNVRTGYSNVPFVSAHDIPTVKLIVAVNRPRRSRFTGCCW